MSFESLDPLVRCLDGERLLLGEWAYGLPASEVRRILGDDVRTLRAVFWGLRPLRGIDHAACLRIMRIYARNVAEPYTPGDGDIGHQMINAPPPTA